jgi:hypothetical protein
MTVIFAMADDALLRHLAAAGRLLVTLGALQLRVRAEQRKMCILGMIEDPQRPTVAGVAGVAFIAEAVLVDIVRRVTANAGSGGLIEGQARVALRAAHHAMQPQQGKIRQVVIENDVFAPVILAVTAGAAALELSAMRIFAAVATLAIDREFLFTRYRGVTEVAAELGMGSLECEFVPL